MKKKISEMIERAEKMLGELKACMDTLNVKESKRFKALPDGWVLDKELGIEWGPSSDKRMDWEEAKKYASDKGGRLPTVKELFALIDHGRNKPAIDTDFFNDTKTDDWYWTGTELSGASNCAWCVTFYYGYVGISNKVNDNYVRPVRSSQCLAV